MRDQIFADFFLLTVICKITVRLWEKYPCYLKDLNPLQLDRIGLAGIPLTDIEIFILVYTHIMTMFENRRRLNH